MNFFSSNSTNGYRLGARSGLSIIEVLTSVVVAMIGVFGVLALIPFAVKQASLGLDSDAAVTTARNAISQMEIIGMQIPQNWVLWNNTADDAVGYDPLGGDLPGVFSLDPLAIAEIAGTADPDVEDFYRDAAFPFRIEDTSSVPFPTQQHHLVDSETGVGAAADDLGIPAATFNSPSGFFDRELARRMCRAGNDLVFAEPDLSDPADADGDGIADSSASGPIQLFDTDGGGGAAQRRQSQGRISWSSIVVPFTNEPFATTIERWSYRMYILVYKDRQFDPAVFNPDGTVQDLGGAMTVALLDTNLSGPQSPVSIVDFQDPVSLGGAVKRDDWVLLINRDPAAPAGFDRRLAFYRVVNFSDSDAGSSASITLDGPDFDFGAAGTETYIVHLKDVLGVYERTFTPELESNWNLSL